MMLAPARLLPESERRVWCAAARSAGVQARALRVRLAGVRWQLVPGLSWGRLCTQVSQLDAALLDNELAATLGAKLQRACQHCAPVLLRKLAVVVLT